MSTMKAAQWDPTLQKVVINQIPIPEPKENEFLVKIASASLCLSDLMSIAIPKADRDYAVTLGHEGAGYVNKLHPSAEGKGFKVGDAVGFLYIIGCCFECRGCMVHNNHCLTQDSRVQGFTADGFFAEYALVDWHSAIVLPSNLDVKTASPLFCAGVTAYHCVDSCELNPGDWLVIIGCGGLGQFATQYAKAMGFKIIGIDINDEILANVKSQGADVVFNSRTNKTYAKEILELTQGGAPAVAVFSNANAAYKSAPPLVRLGGILMVVGLPHDGVTFDALDIARGTYRVKGDSTGIPQRMPKAIAFTAKHNIQPEVEIRTSLDEVPDMVATMQAGKNTKRMVVSL
ncbi:alcohol dehydrogenase [Tricladium varicosporioides]|nr:alcohol dehydrogenase [Hymenoscyphus varicosporioides]